MITKPLLDLLNVDEHHINSLSIEEQKELLSTISVDSVIALAHTYLDKILTSDESIEEEEDRRCMHDFMYNILNGRISGIDVSLNYSDSVRKNPSFYVNGREYKKRFLSAHISLENSDNCHLLFTNEDCVLIGEEDIERNLFNIVADRNVSFSFFEKYLTSFDNIKKLTEDMRSQLNPDVTIEGIRAYSRLDDFIRRRSRYEDETTKTKLEISDDSKLNCVDGPIYMVSVSMGRTFTVCMTEKEAASMKMKYR